MHRVRTGASAFRNVIAMLGVLLLALAMASAPADAAGPPPSVAAKLPAAVGAFHGHRMSSTADPAPGTIYATETGTWGGYVMDPCGQPSSPCGNGPWEGAYEETTVPTASQVTNQCHTTVTQYAWVGLGGAGSSPHYSAGAYTYPFVQNGISIAEPDDTTADHTVMGWYQVWDANAKEVINHWTSWYANYGDDVTMRTMWNKAHDTLFFIWDDLTTGSREVKTISNAAAYWNPQSTVDFIGAETPNGDPTVRSTWVTKEGFTNAHAEQASSTLAGDGVPKDAATNSASKSQARYLEWRGPNNPNEYKFAAHLNAADESYYVNQNYCG